MKLSFSDTEVVAMAVEAIEKGWDPMAGKVLGTSVHGPQTEYKLTLEIEPGIEVRFNTEALKAAMFEAVKLGLTPLRFEDPILKTVTFHNSSEGFAKVEIVDGRIESRFGAEDDGEGDD